MWEPQSYAADGANDDEVSNTNWTKDSLRQWDASVNIATGREQQHAALPFPFPPPPTSNARLFQNESQHAIRVASNRSDRGNQRPQQERLTHPPNVATAYQEVAQYTSPNDFSATASPTTPLYMPNNASTKTNQAAMPPTTALLSRSHSNSLNANNVPVSKAHETYPITNLNSKGYAAASGAGGQRPMNASPSAASPRSTSRTVRVVEPTKASLTTNVPSGPNKGNSGSSFVTSSAAHQYTPLKSSRYEQLANESNALSASSLSPIASHAARGGMGVYVDATNVRNNNTEGYAEEFSGSEPGSSPRARGDLSATAGVRPKVDAASREVGRRYGGGPDARQRALQWVRSAEKHEVACFRHHKAQNIYQRHATTLGDNKALAGATAYSQTHATSSATDIRAAQASKNASRALAHRIDVIGSQPERLRDQRLRGSEQRQESEEYRWARGKAFSMAPLRPMRDGRFETPGPGEYFIPSEFQGTIRDASL